MIENATQEKLSGAPFLIPKTAREIKGIKFLGESSTQSPLGSIGMITVIPRMLHAITAYEELSTRL